MEIILILFFYFVPTLIAAERDTGNAIQIFVVNLFLGWTFVGWVVCLSWSFSGQRKNSIPHRE